MTKRPYEIRDPIHGFIKLSEKERDLINTKVFQRLRRIRQLAMAFLVYPGAVHTRFDHSIGVMHIAGQICKRLKELDHTEICNTTVDQIRFAALLHDVGHGPFSHLSETLLKKFAPTQQTDMGQVLEKIHEKITVDIIRNDTEINNILSPCERNFVVKMIEGKEKRRDWHRDIVSSELDADKMDYLLRDSHFTGVKYGEYDLEKLIESCYIGDHPETPLAINIEGIYALEQFMLARFHMKQQVYWHEVSLISDEMIVRGVTLAIEGGNRKIAKLYKYPKRKKKDSDQDYQKKKKGFIQSYLNYHDEKVINILRNCKQRKASEIFNRLYNRDLFKTIIELRFKYEEKETRDRLQEMVEDPVRKRQCEEKIARCIDIKADADYVIVNKPPVRNLNYESQSKTPDPGAMMIFDENRNKLDSLSEYEGELFLVRPTEAPTLGTVQVYAPYQVSEEKKRKIQDILRSS